MAQRDSYQKGNRLTTSKQGNADRSLLSVTHLADKPKNVTLRRDATPLRCYAKLEPWLRFANLPENANGLHEEYIQQFVTQPTGTFPAVFFQLTTAVRSMRGGQSSKLIETHTYVRDFLESVSTMEPRDTGALAADEEMLVSMVFHASRSEDGRIYFQPEPLRWAFKTALEGVETRRIRRCPICDKLFYALRVTQQTCSHRCNATRRVRAWRANQAKYEQTRKEKPETVKGENKTRSKKPRKEHRK